VTLKLNYFYTEVVLAMKRVGRKFTLLQIQQVCDNWQDSGAVRSPLRGPRPASWSSHRSSSPSGMPSVCPLGLGATAHIRQSQEVQSCPPWLARKGTPILEHTWWTISSYKSWVFWPWNVSLTIHSFVDRGFTVSIICKDIFLCKLAGFWKGKTENGV
jgi:hypothetical protein